MSVQSEISALEERLRIAELGPDPSVFSELLDDQMVILDDSGNPVLAKAMVVAAHHPGRGPKFRDVRIEDLRITDHATTATVTCRGTYKTADATFILKFLRVWVKKAEGWRIVAGAIHQPE